MKKIYCTTIALLCAGCLFLIVYSFGIFDFGAFSQSDEFSFYTKERVSVAKRSSSWNVTVLGNYKDQAYISEFAQGIGRAALLININGGVLGKPLSVTYVEPEEDDYAVSLAVQKLCEDPEVAFLLGPMSASHLKTVRALTQYHALPALAPYSPLFPELPNLVPDLFSALYPTQLLLDPMIERLKSMNCRNVLFVSVGSDSYSGIYTNMLNQKLRNDPFFQMIHRIDFTPPANDGQFYQPLKRIYENSEIDAVIYTDTPENLRVLGRVMKDLEINVPVFGNDLLAVPTLPHYIKDYEFPLYYVTFRGKIVPPDFAEEYVAIFKREPSIKEQLGILGCLFFRDALSQLKTYHPVLAGEMIKELSVTYFSDKAQYIQPFISEINAQRGAIHEN